MNHDVKVAPSILSADFSCLEKEIKAAQKDIDLIRQNKNTSGLDKVAESFSRIYKIGAFQALGREINKVPEKGVFPEFKNIMRTFTGLMATRGSSDPANLGSYLKAGLIVFSALEGEAGSQNLAKAAQNLLKNANEIKKEERRSAFINAGADLLINFGYAAKDPKIINCKNYAGTDNREFLKKAAGLAGKEGGKDRTSGSALLEVFNRDNISIKER